jgi:hypothetical protein
MVDIDWLDFLVMILAAFSVNYLIINEVSIYFSKKTYLSKWALCFVFSIVVVMVKCFMPSA